MKIEPCEVCGTHFNNVFEAIDHLIEEGSEKEFDPALILPGGYKLLIGSMLRMIYEQARSPKQIREIAEHTYATLFAAENDQSLMHEYVEDAIVNHSMYDVDNEIKRLLGGKKKNDDR